MVAGLYIGCREPLHQNCTPTKGNQVKAFGSLKEIARLYTLIPHDSCERLRSSMETTAYSD